MNWTTLSVMAVLACTATAATAKDIKSRLEFTEYVSERKLVDGPAWMKIKPLGQIEGKGPEGGKLEGEWTWKGHYYCRDLTAGGIQLPHDCQQVTVHGDKVTFAHKKGEGISVTWKME